MIIIRLNSKHNFKISRRINVREIQVCFPTTNSEYIKLEHMYNYLFKLIHKV